jgi:hypothetical protein
MGRKRIDNYVVIVLTKVVSFGNVAEDLGDVVCLVPRSFGEKYIQGVGASFDLYTEVSANMRHKTGLAIFGAATMITLLAALQLPAVAEKTTIIVVDTAQAVRDCAFPEEFASGKTGVMSCPKGERVGALSLKRELLEVIFWIQEFDFICYRTEGDVIKVTHLKRVKAVSPRGFYIPENSGWFNGGDTATFTAK